MLEGKLEELITPQHVQAFRELWTVDGEDAREDFLRILSMFSEPLDRNEIERFVARVVTGLVSERPDPTAWLEAHAAGSFAVSKTGPSETPAQLRKRARALARRSGLFLSNIEEYRHAWAEDATKSQDEVRLLLAIAVGKELRKNVAAKAALGPAWPLMVAVNDYFANKEKRALYFYGADNRLQAMIAEAVREALESFTEYHADPAISPPDTADWTREIPPGADVHAYFARSEAEDAADRSIAAEPGEGGITPDSMPLQPIEASGVDATSHKPCAKATFSYMTMPDGTRRTRNDHDQESIDRLLRMMPTLTKRRDDEWLALAARADARWFLDGQVRGQYDKELAIEIREWVQGGHPPPAELRPEHAHLFEEEACSVAFTNPKKLESWQEMGFFPSLPSVNLADTQPFLKEWLETIFLKK